MKNIIELIIMKYQNILCYTTVLMNFHQKLRLPKLGFQKTTVFPQSTIKWSISCNVSFWSLHREVLLIWVYNTFYFFYISADANRGCYSLCLYHANHLTCSVIGITHPPPSPLLLTNIQNSCWLWYFIGPLLACSGIIL